MGHMLIVGATETGKSRLAKRLVAARVKLREFAETAHIVLDALNADWGEGVEVVMSFEELHEAIIEYHAARIPLCVYVDEADIFLSMRDPQNHWLLLRGRHFGLSVTVITQRPAMVAPSVRGMCATLHAFSVSEADAKMLANDYAYPALKTLLVGQMQGHWHHVRWEGKQKTVTALSFPDDDLKVIDKAIKSD